MCDVLSQVACHVPNLPEPTRRRFLQALGVGTFAAGFGTFAEVPAAAAKPFHSNGHRIELVLLGTAGGPALFGGGRFGTSTAISYAGQVYLVDLGAGSFLRLQQSQLAPSQPGVPNTLSPVRASSSPTCTATTPPTGRPCTSLARLMRSAGHMAPSQ